MDKVKDRLTEPSTYIGLGAVVSALGGLFKVNEAAPVADALDLAAQGVASGAPWYTWAPLALGGLLGMFMREKGSR